VTPKPHIPWVLGWAQAQGGGSHRDLKAPRDPGTPNQTPNPNPNPKPHARDT